MGKSFVKFESDIEDILLDMTEDNAIPASYYSIQFGILGSEDIVNASSVSVTKKNLLKNERPEIDGPYDLHMGTTDRTMKCWTCGNIKEYCPGHVGHIVLKYPVQNPLFRDDINKWLRVFCHFCGHIIVNRKPNKNTLKNKLFGEYGKLARSGSDKNPVCIKCKRRQPHIERDKIRPMIIWKVWFSANIEERREQMFNTEIATIFSRISAESVAKMGRPINSHPSNLILTNICVPPNSIRPDTRRGSGVRTTSSDITTIVKTIVEVNNEIKTVPPQKISPEDESRLILLDLLYYSMVRGSSSTNQMRVNTNMNKTPDSLAQRFPKKAGILRKHLLGKRVWYIARSVITGDKNIRPNKIGVPIMIAKQLVIIETVREYNKDRLMKLFINRNNYPGCTTIEKPTETGFSRHRVELISDDIQLEIGDKIHRHLLNDDMVCFNRQPSLTYSSIAAHKVVILEEGQTLRLNSATCNLYNADFDGDEMNMIVASGIASRIEIKYTSSVQKWFMGYKNAKPMMGCFMDALIGSAEFTKNSVKMDRFHAMKLLAQVPEELYDPKDLSKEFYSGRDLITAILPDNVNYKGKAFYYKKEWSKYPSLKYDPSEYNVIIERGVHKQGILDKAAVGESAAGGLFHNVHNEYGPEFTLNLIYAFQQLTTSFFYYQGFTVGLKDVSLSPETRKKINTQISKIVAESELLTKQLYEGTLIPPVGMTLREYYFKQMKAKLEHGDEFIELILNDIDVDENGFYKLIFFGSKGKKDNIISIVATIAQQDIDGNRFIDQFSNGRSSIYFTRNDYSAQAGGYHTTSYTQGIQQTAYIAATQEARNGLINIALSTAIAGEQSRKFIKSLESLYSNYHYSTIRNGKVIQPLYGETAIDPRKVEKIQFKPMMMSDKEFKETYQILIKQFSSEFRNSKIQSLLDDEYKQLWDDRRVYRNLEFGMESQNPHYTATNNRYMPVNIDKLVGNITHKYRGKQKKKLNPAIAIDKIKELCQIIGYLLINEIQEHKKSPIPVHIDKSMMLFRMLIRSELCIKALWKAKLWEEPLNEIIDSIKLHYDNALIDPGTAVGIIAAQSVSEPTTQFVLDSKHLSGAKGTKTNVVDRVKEIASAKPTEKMKTPSMILHIREEYQNNKQKVQEIANHIEMMILSKFVIGEYILYDTYGHDTHLEFLTYNQKIKNFEKYNFGTAHPTDLTRWSILFKLDPEELIMKNMKMETIVHSIQDKFPSLYVVYSLLHSDDVFVRCYLRSNTWKHDKDYVRENVIELLRNILDNVIRGIDRITGTEVTSVVKSYVQEDGSVTTKKIYAIITEGTNLSKCLENPYLDRYNCHSDSIKETELIYGIDGAKQKLFSELKSITEQAAYDSHYSLMADEMTSTGVVTELERTGHDKREPNKVLLATAFHGPIQVQTKAALANKKEIITDPSAYLLMGQIPKIGTNYTEVLLHEEFIQDNKLSAKDIIDLI